MRRRQALAAVGAAIAAPALTRGARADDAVLRVASATFDVSAQVYYAHEMGFLEKAGLTNVTIENFTSGAALTAAVASGAADIGNSNNVSLARAHHQQIPFTIVAPSGVYRSNAPTSVLMVAMNSSLKSASDLSGKTVAVSGLGSLAQIAAQAWIDQHGGSSSAAKFVEMPQPELIAAVAVGRIDAGLVIEPFVADAKAQCRVFADCFDAIAPTFMIGSYFSMLEWAQTHRDVVRRFHAAMAATALWANKNQDKSGAILARLAKLNVSDVRRMNRVFYITESDPKLLQPIIDATAKYGNFPAFAATELIFKA